MPIPLSQGRAELPPIIWRIMPTVFTPVGNAFDRGSAKRESRPEDVSAEGASVYDLTMHISRLLPRRRL